MWLGNRSRGAEIAEVRYMTRVLAVITAPLLPNKRLEPTRREG